jgi:hypothetical protein
MKLERLSGYVMITMIGIGLLVGASANAAKTVQFKLVGKNDINVDRQAIQAAIDSAPGQALTIKLRGTFQLDGTDIQINRSDLIIKGDRQGAILNGLVDPATGFPVIVNPPEQLAGNRGIVLGRSGSVRNIVIKDLTLTGMRTAIFATGRLDGVAVENVLIKNNTISNTLFGVSVDDVATIGIVNNHISDAFNNGIFFQSEVTDAVIKGNLVSTSDDRPGSIPTPLQINDTLAFADISRNTFQGGVAALLLWANATNVTVTNNCVRDGGTQGPDEFRAGGIVVGGPVLVDLDGSGFVIENNSYNNNVWSFLVGTPESRDIWLTSRAYNNAVLESLGTVVKDEEISNNNSVVFHGDGDPGFCD